MCAFSAACCQVLTSYEEGVYAVLFSSVPDEDVKPEWIERANARTQRVSQQVGCICRRPRLYMGMRCGRAQQQQQQQQQLSCAYDQGREGAD
jgi:hypothetical protein